MGQCLILTVGERWENVKVAQWQNVEISSSRFSYGYRTFSWTDYLQRYQTNLKTSLVLGLSEGWDAHNINYSPVGAWSLEAILSVYCIPCKVGPELSPGTQPQWEGCKVLVRSPTGAAVQRQQCTFGASGRRETISYQHFCGSDTECLKTLNGWF